jgi:ammonia channel protein AmtB
LDKLHIDDPVYSSAVNMIGGIWGLLAEGLFDFDRGAVFPYLSGRSHFFFY